MNGRKVLDLSYKEMLNFCGNMLMVVNKKGEECVIMSQSAYDGLTKVHLKTLQNNYKLIVCPIPTIEKIGGGSARCMVAELF